MTITTWRHSWRIHGLFFLFFVALIGYHPIVQRRVIAKCVLAFERECSVAFASSDAIFHLLTGAVVFSDISITKLGLPRPILTAQRGSLSFAPVQSLLCGKFIFESSISGMRIPFGRGIESVLDVVDFFKALLASSSDYVGIRGLYLSDITLGDLSASVKIESGRQDGDESPDISIMHGDFKFPVKPSIKSPVRIGKLVVGVPSSSSGMRTITGELFGRADKSIFLLKEGEFTKALVEYSPHKLSYKAIAPADDFVACVDAMFPDKNLIERYRPYRSFGRAQDLLLTCRGTYVPEQQSGKIEFSSSHSRSKETSSLNGMIIHRGTEVSGDARLVVREGLALRGRFSADLKNNKIRAFIHNQLPAKTFFGKALIPPRGFGLLIKSGTFNTVLGQYTLKACDPEYEKNALVEMKGIFSVHDGQVCSVGHINKKTMYGLGSYDLGPRLKRFVVLDEHNNIEVDVKSSGPCDELLSGKISKKCVRHLIPHDVKSVMSGDGGAFSFKIDQSLMPVKVSGECSLLGSNYCFFGCSNPLISARAVFDVDFMLKAATVSEVECLCSSGMISSKEILLNWSSEGISYFHVPVVVSDLSVNKEKNFYAVIDGECSMDWIDGAKHRLDGAFVIKKSVINSLESAESTPLEGGLGINVPYVEAVGKTQPLGIDANISIKTLEPTVINTPLLRTRAHVDARMGGCVRGDGSFYPKLSGTVRLEGGVFEVLGRPLRIMKGTVDLLPNQSDNPIVDFLAYTNVKQYRIAIHGSGSLQQPNFVFESNPPLSQEQIIGLVLSGSEYADINQQLPGIFLQNIHKVLSPGAQNADKSSLFHPLVRSLRYIQLLPYQDSISSQKTVKARLNIDLGPNLRALVHKDIFGKEAVALQVEYDVSDALNLRLLRQASGQVGAEAEIRFKF